MDLGIPVDRIETICSFQKAAEIKCKALGALNFGTLEVFKELTELVTSGKVKMPITNVYSLDQVKEAFDELEGRHTRGKIVLVP